MVIYMVEIHPITWIILVIGAVAVGFMALFMGRNGTSSTTPQQNTDTTARTTQTTNSQYYGAQSPTGAGNATAPNAYLNPLNQLQSQSLTQQVANNGSSSVYFSQLATMYGFSFQDIYAVHNSLDNANVIITFKDGSVQSYPNPAYVTPLAQGSFQPAPGGAQSTEPQTRALGELTFVDQLGWVDKYGVIYVYSDDTGKYTLNPQYAGSYYYALPAVPPQATLSGFFNFVQTAVAAATPTTQSVKTMDNGSGVMQPYLIQNYSDGSSKVIGPASATQAAAYNVPSEVANPPTLAQVLEKDLVASMQQTGVYTYKLTSTRNYDYGANDPRGTTVTWTGYDPTGAVVDRQSHDPTLTLDPKRVKRIDNSTYQIYGWPYFDITPPASW